MKIEKIRVYLYTRVSTTMQIDGYFLDAQKTKMKAYCDYNVSERTIYRYKAYYDKMIQGANNSP